MKKLLLGLIVAFAMTATAQNKIELTSLGKYRQFKSEVTKARAKAASGTKEKTVGVLVEMNQGNTVGQLEGKVSHIAFDRGTLGSNNGLHSDKSVTCKLFDDVAEKDSIIFCISAGNEGDDQIVQRKELLSSADEMKSIVAAEASEDSNTYNDNVFFEGKGANPFILTPVLYDVNNGDVIDTLKATTGKSEGEKMEDVQEYTYAGKELRVTTSVTTKINDETGNFEALLDYTLESTECPTSDILIGYIISGVDEKPTTVTAYVESTCTLAVHGDDDWREDITTDGTINTIACGNHTISVGNYITRYLTTETKGFDSVFDPEYVEDGDMEPSSSWGTLYDGRSFPHIAAPGTNVISSINSYNTEENDPDVTYYSTTKDGRDYHFAGYTGTSMSTPAMSGVVALWLEADPTLTVDKARTIAMETAIVDDNVMNAVFPVQFGAGKVDALAGLKRVLAEAPTSVKELNERGGKNILIELKGDRTISVFAANETQLNATLYTADGRTVSQVSISGNTLDINAPSAGIYVLKVGGLKSAAVRKVVVE